MNNGSNGVATLQARLNEPQTAAALNRLLDRIETLEQTVGRLADALEQAPGMVAMLGDMADETIRQASTRGVNIEARLRAALTIAEKLTAPETTAKLDQLLTLADQAPSIIAMLGDIMDESYRRASESGINLEAMIRQGARAGAKFSTLMESKEFDALMESGVLDPEAVASVGKVGQALIASQKHPSQSLGLFGLLSAMRDPNMQRALGFLATFGTEFGKQISK